MDEKEIDEIEIDETVEMEEISEIGLVNFDNQEDSEKGGNEKAIGYVVGLIAVGALGALIAKKSKHGFEKMARKYLIKKGYIIGEPLTDDLIEDSIEEDDETTSTN